jgi:photosystem II stability/assembly factor-like uncharacterized protein
LSVDALRYYMTTLYATVAGGFAAVRGADGDAPDATRGLAARRPDPVAVHPARPDRVVVGTADGALLRSTDGGETFATVGDLGADVDRVTAVATTPADPDEWWAGTEPSAVYRSTDGGATWSRRPGLTDLPSASTWSFPPRPETHHVRWIEVDPHDPAHLHVGVEAGALVSTTDRGATWRDRVPTSRRDVHSMATHPDAPGRVSVAAGDGYAESTDGGETWTYPQVGLDHRYCWSVAVDPGDPEVRLVSAARGASRAHRTGSAESSVYRKRGDDDWEPLSAPGLGGDGVTRAVLAAGDAPGELYAATNVGAFRTADAGDAWTRLDVPGDWFAGGTVRGLAVAPGPDE